MAKTIAQVETVDISAPEKVIPFLRWAGGKRWLTKHMQTLSSNTSGTYYEPFLGGAAMFFSRQPAQAVLSDTNAALIETYQAIQSDFKRVVSHLQYHASNHSTDHYYKVRSTNYRNEYTRAAQFIYLNRTCWNGLYRVNKRGGFNVPIGTKESVIYEGEDFEAVANSLKNSDILCIDFETQIEKAKAGDQIFADPPYTVRHKHWDFPNITDTQLSSRSVFQTLPGSIH